MDRVQLYQGYRAFTRKQFTFYLKSLRVPGTHEPTIEPPCGFEPRIRWLDFQNLNHQAIRTLIIWNPTPFKGFLWPLDHMI